VAVENITTTAGLSEELRTYYSMRLIKRLLARLPMFVDAQKTTIPKNMGKTVQWRRWDSLALVTAALTEGDPPTAQTLATSEVTATLAQYGGYVKISKLAVDTFIDRIADEAEGVLAEQAGRSLHSLLIDVIEAGSVIQYAGAATSRVTVSPTMVLSVAELNEAVRTLELANVPRFADGFYHALAHPRVKYDLINSTTYREQNLYVSTESLRRGELTEIGGVKLYFSTEAPEYVDAGTGGTTEVYATIVYGPDAFGVVDLAGNAVGRIDPETQRGVELIVIPATSPSKSDPLNQYGTVGWIATFVAKIIDNNRMVRIESGATL
jgi:N4-gp56 family major capsid protein